MIFVPFAVAKVQSDLFPMLFAITGIFFTITIYKLRLLSNDTLYTAVN